jgi:hypothetical protein
MNQYAIEADVELANHDLSWISGQRALPQAASVALTKVWSSRTAALLTRSRRGSVASKGLFGDRYNWCRRTGWCRIINEADGFLPGFTRSRCRTVLEVEMQMLSPRNIAAAAFVVCLPIHGLMAQNAPNAGPPVLIPAPTLPPPAAASPPPAATPAPKAIAPEPTATAPAPSASVPASTATAPPSNATAPTSTATAPAPTAAAPVPAVTAPAPTATAPAPTTTATAPAGKATAPVATGPDAATTTEHATKKKKQPAKMTRQQELEKSIDTGTVPARYRNSVPKEYQQYIPFAK